MIDRSRPRGPFNAIIAACLTAFLVLLPVSTAEAAVPRSAVVATWKNANKTKIVLRKGIYSKASGKGFGWQKIKDRHGLKKYSTVRHPTKSPFGGITQGNRVVYTAYADKLKKYHGRWYVEAEIPVKTVVEFKHVTSYYGVKLNNAPGVLTTYCVLPNRAKKCPSWVETAFLPTNNGSVQAGRAGVDFGATGYASSFSPRGTGTILPGPDSP